MQNEHYCNNCGKGGHMYHQCKMPITSIGIVVFRKVNDVLQYLMIRRKDSLGHIDFMRGKYSVANKHYIVNMLNQMTADEKRRMKTDDFDKLWFDIWLGNSISSQYKSEEVISREKFKTLSAGVSFNQDFYTLKDLIEISDANGTWEETEWGFPKGRRNTMEKDYDCALREFEEETGYSKNSLKNVQNIMPYEEIFTGSNYKSYKHKYYLMYMENATEVRENQSDPTEVSKMEWKTYEQCLACIRDYNAEKKRLIARIHNTLTKYILV